MTKVMYARSCECLDSTNPPGYRFSLRVNGPTLRKRRVSPETSTTGSCSITRTTERLSCALRSVIHLRRIGRYESLPSCKPFVKTGIYRLLTAGFLAHVAIGFK